MPGISPGMPIPDAIHCRFLKLSIFRQLLCTMRQARSSSGSVVFSASLIGTRELIREMGGEPEAPIRAARVPPYAFDSPDIYFDAECFVDYLELAAEACRCPEFGLIHASRWPMGVFGQIWLLMRDAETVAAALRCYVKYFGLFTDMGTFRFEQADGGQWLHYVSQPLGRYGRRQVINATLAVVFLFVRANAPAQHQPPRVRLRQPPVDNDSFTGFFGRCPDFDSVSDALFIDNTTLDRQIGRGELRGISRQSVLLQSQMKGPVILSEVKSLLSVLLPSKEASLKMVAETMRYSERSLQRRLEHLGTGFRELVDAVRAEQAWHHVTSSRLPISQIAFMLGYETHSAFARAFKRWHGTSSKAARSDASNNFPQIEN